MRRVAARPARPFEVEHFRRYAALMVWDDGEQRELEPWQLEVAADIFAGFREWWLLLPEGNGKSTFVALLALYGADYSQSPWIPVAAAAAKQARIVYDQAEGFVTRTPGMRDRFRPYPGYLKVVSLANGGRGIDIFAADDSTADGVIPYPFAIVDELHRHRDMRLYGLWRGKLRKRGAQILCISTAGEPETEFELTRDSIRDEATERTRVGSHLRAVAGRVVMHEWMVPADDLCENMAAVAAANPLSSVSAETLAEDYASPTLAVPDWKRLKCNRPCRGQESAITDAEWDGAETSERIPPGAAVDLGLDVAWKLDTTAFVPLWRAHGYKLLGEATILVPPRDGSMLHPDAVKGAYLGLAAKYRIGMVVMDTTRAEDIAAWLEEQGVPVVDRQQTNKPAVEDYYAFMDGIRNGTLRHTGCPGLRSHVLHAIARRLSGGDYRFDRPSATRDTAAQERHVIDALSAAAMVNSCNPPATSVYETRGLAT